MNAWSSKEEFDLFIQSLINTGTEEVVKKGTILYCRKEWQYHRWDNDEANIWNVDEKHLTNIKEK